MQTTQDRLNILTIKTPEGVLFSYVLASPVTRMLAWIVDSLCVLFVLSLMNVALVLFSLLAPDLVGAFYYLGAFVISIGYSIALEWYWRGQTLGKRLFRLRVVDAQGLRLQFNQIVMRNLVRFADALPLFYLVGGTACVISRYRQRLGDLAANTVVIRSPKLTEPDLDQILAGKFNSLRKYPHLAARLRQKAGPDEAALALHAILRRDEFAPEARLALFGDIARHFASLVAFPEDATEGISDEQYVRNVVDVLYRTKAAE